MIHHLTTLAVTALLLFSGCGREGNTGNQQNGLSTSRQATLVVENGFDADLAIALDRKELGQLGPYALARYTIKPGKHQIQALLAGVARDTQEQTLQANMTYVFNPGAAQHHVILEAHYELLGGGLYTTPVNDGASWIDQAFDFYPDDVLPAAAEISSKRTKLERVLLKSAPASHAAFALHPDHRTMYGEESLLRAINILDEAQGPVSGEALTAAFAAPMPEKLSNAAEAALRPRLTPVQANACGDALATYLKGTPLASYRIRNLASLTAQHESSDRLLTLFRQTPVAERQPFAEGLAKSPASLRKAILPAFIDVAEGGWRGFMLIDAELAGDLPLVSRITQIVAAQDWPVQAQRAWQQNIQASLPKDLPAAYRRGLLLWILKGPAGLPAQYAANQLVEAGDTDFLCQHLGEASDEGLYTLMQHIYQLHDVEKQKACIQVAVHGLAVGTESGRKYALDFIRYKGHGKSILGDPTLRTIIEKRLSEEPVETLRSDLNEWYTLERLKTMDQADGNEKELLTLMRTGTYSVVMEVADLLANSQYNEQLWPAYAATFTTMDKADGRRAHVIKAVRFKAEEASRSAYFRTAMMDPDMAVREQAHLTFINNVADKASGQALATSNDLLKQVEEREPAPELMEKMAINRQSWMIGRLAEPAKRNAEAAGRIVSIMLANPLQLGIVTHGFRVLRQSDQTEVIAELAPRFDSFTEKIQRTVLNDNLVSIKQKHAGMLAVHYAALTSSHSAVRRDAFEDLYYAYTYKENALPQIKQKMAAALKAETDEQTRQAMQKIWDKL